MLLSRSSRRLIAGIAAVLFVACQSVALVHAGIPGAPQPDAGMALDSCHDSGNSANDNEVCEGSCRTVSSSLFKVNVFAVTDLPALTVSVARFVPFNDAAPRVEAWTSHADPPPLAILHCCLRN